MPVPRRTPTRLLAVFAAAGLAAALSGCDGSWSRREHEAVRQALEQVQAAAKAPSPDPETVLPAPPGAEKTGEVRLDLFQAIRLALQNNQDIQIAGYEPLRAEADLIEARAVYDPTIVASNEFARNDQPTASTLDTGAITDDALIEDTWDFSYGLRQRVPTGGTFSVTQQMGYLDSNSRFTVPNPQYTSGLIFEANQPLLKGLGDPEAQAAIRIATLSAGVTLQDFREKVTEIVAKVTAAYWQLAFDRRMVEVYGASLEQAREVQRREEVRAARGISNALNIARAASAVAFRQTQFIRAKNQAKDSADRLKTLLNAPELPVQGEADVVPVQAPRFFEVDIDRTAAMAQALAHRPELVRARTGIDIRRVQVDAAARQRLPRLDALLRYTLHGLDSDLGGAMDMQHFRDPTSWVGGLELEWPLGVRTARAELRRRRIDYEQTLLEADRLTDQVLEEVSTAVRAVRRGREEVESTLQARQATQTVLDGERTRLELQPMDRRSNEELLRAQEQLAQAKREHLTALLNFNLALTELSRTRGTILADQGIEVVWPEEDRPGRLMPVGTRISADEPPEQQP